MLNDAQKAALAAWMERFVLSQLRLDEDTKRKGMMYINLVESCIDEDFLKKGDLSAVEFELKMAGILDAINLLVDIYKHPCPQNRNPRYFIRNDNSNDDEEFKKLCGQVDANDEDVINFVDELGKDCREPKGFINLTVYDNAQNINCSRSDVLDRIEPFLSELKESMKQMKKKLLLDEKEALARERAAKEQEQKDREERLEAQRLEELKNERSLTLSSSETDSTPEELCFMATKIMNNVSAEDNEEMARAKRYLELAIDRDSDFAPPVLALRFLIRRTTPSFNPTEDANLLATARLLAGTSGPKQTRGVNYIINSLSKMPAGEFLLGAWYELLQKDYKRAVVHYTNAAKAGYALAQANLAICLKAGRGCNPDLASAVSWWRKSADQGYAVARYNLAYCYLNGEGVAKSPEQAYACYLKNAAQGHVGAMYSLGHLYMDGEGVAKDPVEACRWYHKASLQDNPAAQAMYGRCLLTGNGVEKDPVAAIEWLLRAAKGENNNGRVYLAACYLQGIGVTQNYVEAVALLKKAAVEDDAEAQVALADCYTEGIGCKVDMEIAASMYRKAANQNSANGQYSLGMCYLMGKGIGVDPDLGFAFVKKAAMQGHPEAMTQLGGCLMNGVGTGQDTTEALKWYAKAARAGHAPAETVYGMALMKNAAKIVASSSGSRQEAEEMEKDGLKWLKTAAGEFDKERKPFGDALNALGEAYMNGTLTIHPTNMNKVVAFEYFQLGAKLGNVMAEYNYGCCCRLGIGTKEDHEEAMYILAKAAADGHRHALMTVEAHYHGRGVDLIQQFKAAKEAMAREKDMDAIERQNARKKRNEKKSKIDELVESSASQMGSRLQNLGSNRTR